MGILSHPVVPITTAASEPLSGDYQFWTLENPDTNANAIFYNPNQAATTTATQSKQVRPGQTAVFFVNWKENPGGVSLIAATGATTVNLTKETFRTRLGYTIANFVAGIAASVASYWIAISGTQIALSGPFVEARADTVSNKTAATDVAITNRDTTTAGVRIGAGPNHGLSNGSVLIGLGGNGAEVASAGATMRISGNTITQWTATSFDHGAISETLYATPFSDPRHSRTTTTRVLHTPVAGGVLSSSSDAIEIPIASGATISPGDITEYAPNLDNRVQASAAGSVNPQLGVCLSGGVGNAGGTVFARVAIRGIYVGLVANAAGVTAGQYGAAGATTANRLLSTAAVTANSFCRILKTAATGVATTISLGLT